jgi:DnaJ-class molecular chaperone
MSEPKDPARNSGELRCSASVPVPRCPKCNAHLSLDRAHTLELFEVCRVCGWSTQCKDCEGYGYYSEQDYWDKAHCGTCEGRGVVSGT